MTAAITIISASTRLASQSSKVARFIKMQLEQREQTTVCYVDLATHLFPPWNQDYWTQGKDWHSGWTALSETLLASDGFVFVVPEWNGMPPPQFFNMLQLCSNRELWHKPALLVTVSAGLGGTYPISLLHASSFKNLRVCYLPEHIIIRHVGQVLNHISNVEHAGDEEVRLRIQEGLSILLTYTLSFKDIRKHPSIKEPKFTNGM